MSTKTPRVSILISVYNGEKFIKRCLDSLIKQTVKDFEVVIINDGSTDNSLQKIQKYADKYSFISVFSQENKGLSAARNASIKHSRGEFFTFLDIDDSVDEDYVETLVNGIDSNDVLITGFKRLDGDDTLFIKYPVVGSPWTPYKLSIGCAKLYRRSLIKRYNISFPEMYKTMGEDNYFIIGLLAHTKKIKSIHYAGYNCYVNPKSITHLAATDKKYSNDHMQALLNTIYKDFGKSKNIYWPFLYYFFVKSIVLHILVQNQVYDYSELKQESSQLFHWLNNICHQRKTTIHLHWQKDEEFIVNFTCNIFLLFYKLKLLNLILYPLNKTKVGKFK